MVQRITRISHSLKLCQILLFFFLLIVACYKFARPRTANTLLSQETPALRVACRISISRWPRIRNKRTKRERKEKKKNHYVAERERENIKTKELRQLVANGFCSCKTLPLYDPHKKQKRAKPQKRASFKNKLVSVPTKSSGRSSRPHITVNINRLPSLLKTDLPSVPAETPGFSPIASSSPHRISVIKKFTSFQSRLAIERDKGPAKKAGRKDSL